MDWLYEQSPAGLVDLVKFTQRQRKTGDGGQQDAWKAWVKVR